MSTADSESRLVLVVDDDDDIREVASAALEMVNGFRTVTATSGQEALLRAEEHCPDAILLDVMMPGLGGPETAIRLKQNAATAHIPVVLLTARVTDRHAHEEEVAGVIAKPFDPMRLGAEVSRILGWAT